MYLSELNKKEYENTRKLIFQQIQNTLSKTELSKKDLLSLVILDKMLCHSSCDTKEGW